MESAFSIIAVLLLAGLVAGVWEAVRLLRRMTAQLSALVRIQRRAHPHDETAPHEPTAARKMSEDRRVSVRPQAFTG